MRFLADESCDFAVVRALRIRALMYLQSLKSVPGRRTNKLSSWLKYPAKLV